MTSFRRTKSSSASWRSKKWTPHKQTRCHNAVTLSQCSRVIKAPHCKSFRTNIQMLLSLTWEFVDQKHARSRIQYGTLISSEFHPSKGMGSNIYSGSLVDGLMCMEIPCGEGGPVFGKQERAMRFFLGGGQTASVWRSDAVFEKLFNGTVATLRR